MPVTETNENIREEWRNLSPKMQAALAEAEIEQQEYNRKREEKIAAMTDEEREVYQREFIKMKRHMAKKMASGIIPLAEIEKMPD